MGKPVNTAACPLKHLNGKEVIMAKTDKGKKIVPVKPHKRSAPGPGRKSVPVRRHRRSTPD